MKSVFIETLTEVFSLRSSQLLIGGDSHSSYSFTGVQMNYGSLCEEVQRAEEKHPNILQAEAVCRFMDVLFLVRKLL